MSPQCLDYYAIGTKFSPQSRDIAVEGQFAHFRLVAIDQDEQFRPAPYAVFGLVEPGQNLMLARVEPPFFREIEIVWLIHLRCLVQEHRTVVVRCRVEVAVEKVIYLPVPSASSLHRHIDAFFVIHISIQTIE